MKQFFKLALIAMFVSATAGAAQLPDSFTASDGQVFQVNTALSVEKDGSNILLKYKTGYKYVPDASGAVFAKVQARMANSATFVQVPTKPTRYVNVAAAQTISCNNSMTQITYVGEPSPEFLSDGCQLWQAVKAVSN